MLFLLTKFLLVGWQAERRVGLVGRWKRLVPKRAWITFLAFGEMKPWKKEVLMCLGGGAAIVGTFLGLGEVFGAKFGSCGPANDAAIFSILAVLPGLPVFDLLSSEGSSDWLGTVVLFTFAICGYALPVWIVRRIFHRRRAVKRQAQDA